MALKTRNLRRVANFIEKNKSAFHQWNFYSRNSDNIGCVAAFCVYLIKKNPKLLNSKVYSSVVSRTEECANTFLGIGVEQEYSNCGLFFARGPWTKYWKELCEGCNINSETDRFMENITADMAILLLRNLASGKWNLEDCQRTGKYGC